MTGLGAAFKRLLTWPLRKVAQIMLRSTRDEISQLVRAELKSERKVQHWIVRNELLKSQSNIHFAELREANKASYEYAKKHFGTAKSFQDKFKLRDSLFEDHPLIDGLVLEFGVFKGESITQLAGLFPARTIHGFDSFAGLPEDWRPGFSEGHFETEIPSDLPSNVQLHPGVFDEVLPGFLESNESPVAFLHIDCDLYSSTNTIFNLLHDRLESGSIILFDEYFNYPGWEGGEFKAFQEFIASTHATYRYVSYNASQCQVSVIID